LRPVARYELLTIPADRAADAPIEVSSDNDLLILDPWQNRRILRPADYLRFA
jgi:hypothetical protein